MSGITEQTGKNANTGVIEGTVKNRHTETEYSFRTEGTWRDEQNGTLRFHGSMKDPEGESKYMQVSLQLSKSDQPAGSIAVGDPKILHLALIKGESGEQVFKAISGEVTLERHPENAVKGQLTFTTSTRVFISYDVDVTFQFE